MGGVENRDREDLVKTNIKGSSLFCFLYSYTVNPLVAHSLKSVSIISKSPVLCFLFCFKSAVLLHILLKPYSLKI